MVYYDEPRTGTEGKLGNSKSVPPTDGIPPEAEEHERNPKLQIQMLQTSGPAFVFFGFRSFEFVSNFEIRASNFGMGKERLS